MDTIASHQKHFNNLPPELMDKIFEHTTPPDLARNRTVCGYWRNIIESLYPTRLEMNNANWEAYVTKSTGSKIHLKISSVQNPIYEAPEFTDFVSRVRILELTGLILQGNVINILNGCHNLRSLTIDKFIMDENPRHLDFNSDEGDLVLALTELNIGEPIVDDETSLSDILFVVNHAGALLKSNCLKELNLNSGFGVKKALRLLFAGVFEEEPPTDDPSMAINRVLNNQKQSLQRITFHYRDRRVVQATPPIFVQLHPYGVASPAVANSVNGIHIPQICEFNLRPYFFDRQVWTMLLPILETQFKLKNLHSFYTNQADLDRLESIINHNCETLEEIEFISMESTEQDTFRWWSCTSFTKCMNLKKLQLHSHYRKVRLLDLLHLPTSLETLLLCGFAPTGSSEMFGVSGALRYPNLTKVSLTRQPWFIQDDNPVDVFDTTQLRWLLNLFSGIRQLTLAPYSTRLVPEPVSAEFQAWCRQGGGDNVKIDSIRSSGTRISTENVVIQDTVTHNIRIGKHQSAQSAQALNH